MRLAGVGGTVAQPDKNEARPRARMRVETELERAAKRAFLIGMRS